MMPERIGRYQLLEALGRGAIGDVFRALDPDLNREVAVKIILRPGTLDSEEIRGRFRREVQLAAHLHHPHIITVYDVGLDHDPPYLVTELLAGGTLSSLFQKRHLPWQEALALLQPICEALAYAHEAGIIHRDVKPDNIMFTKEVPQTLKLADFGLAYRGDTDRLTQSGGIMGTIAYMSPEQANGEAIDARTDIYALGLILFEAICGYNPQRGESISQTLVKATSYESLDLSELNDKAPPRVTAVLRRALAKDRRRRYGNCSVLCQDIFGCLEQLSEPEQRIKAAAIEVSTVSNEALGVQVKNVSGQALPPNAEDILRLMFDGYQHITIKEELGGGYSGSRVFVARPVRDSRRQELPAVLKFAPIRLIEQEWHAYQAYIRDQLSGVAQIQGKPVLPSGSTWGGLRYRLAGSGAIEFESLHRAYRRASMEELQFLLADRLFQRLGALWRFNYPAPDFHLGSSYDHLLPVNLILRPGAVPSNSTIQVIRAGDMNHSHLAPGDGLRLSGFIVTEIDEEDQSVTLNWPTAEGTTIASYRVRLQPVADLNNFQVNQIADGLEGTVTNTRMEMMRSLALQIFGWDFDVSSARLSIQGSGDLPNPLSRLPAAQAATPTVRLASIHGDLNPENILVDPATWDVRLIDFATARQDHVLHDFLRLETGIVTRLLVETLAEAGLPPESIVRLYEQVHCASFARPRRPVPDLASPVLAKPFTMLVTLRKSAQTYLYDPAGWREYYQGLTLYLLGALKFKNLDAVAKKVAFWGAAVAQGFLDEPPPCTHTGTVAVAAPILEETSKPKPIMKTLDNAVVDEKAIPDLLEEPQAGLTLQHPAGENRMRSWLAQNWLPALMVGALLAILTIAIIQDQIGNGNDSGDTATQPPAVSNISPTVAATDTRRPTATLIPPTFTPLPPTPRPSVTVPIIDVAGEKASIVVLLDTSISMNQDQKIVRALDGLSSFVDRLDPDDELFVYTFGDEVRQLQPSGRVEDVREELKQRIGSLFADGDTLLYDALCQSLEYLVERQIDEIAGEERTYGLILLTDGRDSGRGVITSEEDLTSCLASAGEQVNIQIITLAYGVEADVDLLGYLAESSSGQSFTESPDSIHERFLTISLNK